jgi:hypothetical protein
MASYNLHDHRGNIQKVFHGTTLKLASIYQGKSGRLFVGYSVSASRFEAENSQTFSAAKSPSTMVFGKIKCDVAHEGHMQTITPPFD